MQSMAERRKRLVLKLFMVSFLAVGLCRELTSTSIEDSVPHTSTKSATTKPFSKYEDTQSTWERAHKDFRVPKHILKLMQRLSLDRSQNHSNVIRGYSPNLNFACMKPVYVFSLKRHRSEIMQASHLHFLAGEKRSRFTIDIHIHLLPNTSSACQLVGIEHRQIENRGWQDVDLTSQISDFINISVTDPSPILLGISFHLRATERSPGHGITQKMVSNHARPFLLIYADEDESSDNNELPWPPKDSAYSTTATNMRPDRPTHSRHTRSVANNTSPVMTNEFPGSRMSHTRYTTFQDFTKQDSDRRKAKRSKKRKSGSRRHGKALLPDQTSSAKEDSEELLPSHGTNADHVVFTEEDSQGTCTRYPMYVEFNALQWDSHIIAPRGFQAFYCAGDCSFPHFKSGKPSNHATIQSAMNVAGLHPKIPPPCCAPDALSSLSILFFDEDDSLKLKTYQNMVVESCACR